MFTLEVTKDTNERIKYDMTNSNKQANEKLAELKKGYPKAFISYTERDSIDSDGCFKTVPTWTIFEHAYQVGGDYPQTLAKFTRKFDNK